MPCTYCNRTNHARANCPEIICYQCGHTGHMSLACPQPNEERRKICWTCKGTDHKRNDIMCPGSRTLFCSYCFSSGRSTEQCPCNEVKTRNLVKESRPSIARERVGRRVQPVVNRPENTGAIPKGRKKVAEDPYPCVFSAIVDGRYYNAVVDPTVGSSWINPDLVYVKDYNGVSQFLRTKVIIHGIEREITFETDISMGKNIILGADGIMTFGIHMQVGGKDLTKIDPENKPIILKKPKVRPPVLPVSRAQLRNPVNLNYRDSWDEDVDVHGIPLVDFLDRIDDVLEDRD